MNDILVEVDQTIIGTIPQVCEMIAELPLDAPVTMNTSNFVAKHIFRLLKDKTEGDVKQFVEAALDIQQQVN